MWTRKFLEKKNQKPTMSLKIIVQKFTANYCTSGTIKCRQWLHPLQHNCNIIVVYAHRFARGSCYFSSWFPNSESISLDFLFLFSRNPFIAVALSFPRRYDTYSLTNNVALILNNNNCLRVRNAKSLYKNNIKNNAVIKNNDNSNSVIRQ